MSEVENIIEKALLSNVLRGRDEFDCACQIVGPDCFSVPAYRNFFVWLKDNKDDFEKWEFLTIANALKNQNKMEYFGGVVWLVDIYNSDFTGAHTAYHATLLLKNHLTRRRMELLEQMKESPDESRLELEQVENRLFALTTQETRDKPAELRAKLEDEMTGLRKAAPMPWDDLYRFSRALLPGTVTLLCGNPGACKSFMTLQLFSYLTIFLKIKTALYELEEDVAFHLSRALAQHTSSPWITYPEGVAEIPLNTQMALDSNVEYIRAMSDVIDDAPNQQTYEQISHWVDRRAKEGCRVIGVDPITAAAHTRRDTWGEDNTFMQSIKSSAVKYGASIFLVTHPSKTLTIPDMNQIAGSAAFSRFAQTIFWMESHEEKESSLRTQLGTDTQNHKLTLHILKARNSIGGGLRLGMELSQDSLCVKELGILVKKKK
jgi:replicative DNA helicase